MRVDSNYIRESLTEFWPEIETMSILLDKDFWVPSLAEVEKYFKESKLSEMQFVEQLNDCDDFSEFFLVEIKYKRYEMYMNGTLPKEQAFPLSMGRAVCDLSRGMQTMHVVDLAICEEGKYMFDLTPMSNRFWKANPSDDNVLIFET